LAFLTALAAGLGIDFLFVAILRTLSLNRLLDSDQVPFNVSRSGVIDSSTLFIR
jgi:hypothetical protein